MCRDKFIAECEEFCSIFDLTGEGKRKREAVNKRKLEELINNTIKLKSGAVEMSIREILYISVFVTRVYYKHSSTVPDIHEIQKEKAEVDVLEEKKQELLNGIKDLEFQHKGTTNHHRLLFQQVLFSFI